MGVLEIGSFFFLKGRMGVSDSAPSIFQKEEDRKISIQEQAVAVLISVQVDIVEVMDG